MVFSSILIALNYIDFAPTLTALLQYTGTIADEPHFTVQNEGVCQQFTLTDAGIRVTKDHVLEIPDSKKETSAINFRVRSYH